MKSIVRKYKEKHFYKKYDISDFDKLKELGICEEKNGQAVFCVTGIYIICSVVYIIFPCGYNNDNDKEDIPMILDLFNILQKEKKMNQDEYSDVEIQYEGHGELISTAYEIIKDYNENGYVQIQHIIEGLNTGGKINWKKTVRLKNNMINEDGIPVYTDFIRRRLSVNQDALLKSLHVYAINKSIAMFGFLFGINTELNENEIDIPVEKNYALHFLKNEKNNTFNSRLLKVISLLIKFIESSEEESDKNSVAGISTKTFYAVWELMCKNVFRDEYNKYSQRIPRPYWKEYGGESEYTEQIPDIVYADCSTLYILDAKYYFTAKRKPGWHDLVKQYFYEMSLRAVMKEIKFSYNVMIIPSEENEIIRYWAFSKVENVPSFGQVIGIKADMKTIIKDYCYGSRHDYRKILDECLERINT